MEILTEIGHALWIAFAILGNFVAVDFGIWLVRRCAGGGLERRDEQAPAR